MKTICFIDDSEYEHNLVKNEIAQAEAATGKKCERCWVHETSVGSDSEHPTICQRCRNALAEMK